MSKKTLTQVKKENLPFWAEENKSKDESELNYFYKDGGYWSLIINGVDVLADKEAINCEIYPDLSYFYETETTSHYIKLGVDLFKKLKVNKKVKLFQKLTEDSFCFYDTENQHFLYNITEIN